MPIPDERIFTPSEADSANANALRECMRKVNEDLTKGNRAICVPPGLAKQVIERARAAGWAVEPPAPKPTKDGSPVWNVTLAFQPAKQ